MIIRKAYKYRIYPTKKQISNMENQFSMCRHLYNMALQERKDYYEKQKVAVTYHQQQNNLPFLKKERPWYKGVYSQTLQDVLKRLDKGFQAFFRRIKAGEVPGYPKFRKRGQWNSLTYPQYNSFPARRIKVPKVGDIKLVYHRNIPDEAKIKTLTITKEADKWFACFSVELKLDIEPEQNLSSALGIDLGLIDFYYSSDGSSVKAPKYLRQKEKQLKRLYRRFSKAKRYSVKWYKILKAIKKCHYRIKCQRDNFLHQEACKLLNKTDIVFYENLKIKNMSKRPEPKQDENSKRFLPNGATAKSRLNKSIADAGWGKFVNILNYKAVELNKTVFPVKPYYTSQKCSVCGEIVKKSLSIRTHVCKNCGFIANRDYNASLNILRIGMNTFQASV